MYNQRKLWSPRRFLNEIQTFGWLCCAAAAWIFCVHFWGHTCEWQRSATWVRWLLECSATQVVAAIHEKLPREKINVFNCRWTTFWNSTSCSKLTDLCSIEHPSTLSKTRCQISFTWHKVIYQVNLKLENEQQKLRPTTCLKWHQFQMQVVYYLYMIWYC